MHEDSAHTASIPQGEATRYGLSMLLLLLSHQALLGSLLLFLDFHERLGLATYTRQSGSGIYCLQVGLFYE